MQFIYQLCELALLTSEIPSGPSNAPHPTAAATAELNARIKKLIDQGPASSRWRDGSVQEGRRLAGMLRSFLEVLAHLHEHQGVLRGRKSRLSLLELL